jgi:hypothetical protein
MPYVYEEQKAAIFTEQGQRMFLAIRDNVRRLLKQAGAVRMQEAIRTVTGDVWEMIACVDRMEELGEIRKIPQSNVPGQHEVYVSGRED